MALRPAGVLRAVASIAAASSPWPVEHRIVWHQGEPDPSRVRVAARITETLAELPPEAWVLAVDDDNLLCPELPRCLAAAVERRPDALAIVFGQRHPQVPECLHPTLPPTPGKIDGGQVALQAGYARMEPWRAGPLGDGTYLATLYPHHPTRWLVVDEPLTYHNAQEWL
jgi:hypothetical protein